MFFFFIEEKGMFVLLIYVVWGLLGNIDVVELDM